MLASSGYIAQVEQRKCIACNTCGLYCQIGALELVKDLIKVDEVLCMGCGLRLSKCREGALSLRLEPSRGKPLDIIELVEASQRISSTLV
jgi:heterodisulfide reductase subunit A-like polyferredoxin